VFKITPMGDFILLHQFTGDDGARPRAGVIQATDGNFYGTTSVGGANGGGTIFEITAEGEFFALYSFLPQSSSPQGALLQATNGTFYGTTSGGGAFNDGIVFRASAGLGPFIAFVQGAGKVGQTGGILGQAFTGTTSVSFSGISATFTVVSDTFIRATVPPGATTGYVTVTTPSDTLTSNVPFYVLP
jgi:uncharacterized repeat protein (TIGR03803 family)